MTADTFICGTCQLVFHNINVFVHHKAEGTCAKRSELSSSSVLHLSSNAVAFANAAYFIIQDTAQISDINVFQETLIGSSEANAAVVPNKNASDQENALEQFCGQVLEMVPVPENGIDGVTGGHGIDIQLFVRPASSTVQNSDVIETATKTGRKRGRPRKGEAKNPVALVQDVTGAEETNLPLKDSDGKLRCVRCLRSFGRERHFKTHRCLATIGYVDIAAKEMPEETDKTETSGDFAVGQDGIVSLPSAALCPEAIVANKKITRPLLDGQRPSKKRRIENQRDVANTVGLPNDSSNVRSKGRALPVFHDENDRIAFDRSLRVDLGPLVDHLFVPHAIDQEIGQEVDRRTGSRPRLPKVSVWSCRLCRKVFKSPSHARLHCLVHTDLRPFKCFKCSYATNTRGNLYTHMRTHTGMVFRCESCDFAAANRGHLVDHRQTHSSSRHACDICHRDYNTEKSLINHVRKYHRNAEGVTYLKQFQKRHRQRLVLLHQCRICRRKFKKRPDFERHLRAHGDAPGHVTGDVMACEVCDHTASCRASLEDHLAAHEFVYVCAVCGAMFPSSIRLRRHLSERHEGSGEGNSGDKLFWRSVGKSMFSPGLGSSMGEADGGDPRVRIPRDEELGSRTPSDDPGKVIVAVAPAQSDHAGRDVIQSDVIQSDVIQSDVIQSDVIQSDVIQNDVIQSDVMRNDVMRSDIMRSDVTTLNVSESCTAEPDSSFDSEGRVAVTDGKSTERSSEGLTSAALALDVFKKLGFALMSQTTYEYIVTALGTDECEFCGRRFSAQTELQSHASSNHSEMHKNNMRGSQNGAVFTCHLCTWTGRSRSALWVHCHRKHKSRPEYLCTRCKTICNSLKRLRVHLQLLHSDLSETQVQDIVLSFHRPSSKLGRQVHECSHCGKKFFSALNLQRHVWIHEGVKPYRCSACQYSCRSRSNLSAHVARHSAGTPFRCPQCSKPYRSRTALRWHVRSHNGGQVFACDRCPYKAIQLSHLKRHLQMHDVAKQFTCGLCSYSANTETHLKSHHSRDHEGVVVPGDDHVTEEEVTSSSTSIHCTGY